MTVGLAASSLVVMITGSVSTRGYLEAIAEAPPRTSLYSRPRSTSEKARMLVNAEESRTGVLRVLSPDQQHLRFLGAVQAKCSGSTQHPLSQRLGAGPGRPSFSESSGSADVRAKRGAVLPK